VQVSVRRFETKEIRRPKPRFSCNHISVGKSLRENGAGRCERFVAAGIPPSAAIDLGGLRRGRLRVLRGIAKLQRCQPCVQASLPDQLHVAAARDDASLSITRMWSAVPPGHRPARHGRGAGRKPAVRASADCGYRGALPRFGSSWP